MSTETAFEMMNRANELRREATRVEQAATARIVPDPCPTCQAVPDGNCSDAYTWVVHTPLGPVDAESDEGAYWRSRGAKMENTEIRRTFSCGHAHTIRELAAVGWAIRDSESEAIVKLAP